MSVNLLFIFFFIGEGARRTPLPCCAGFLVYLLRLWEDHSIDHVDYSIAGQNIRLNDFGFVDSNTFLVDLQLGGLAVNHLHHTTLNVLTHHLAGNNMVGEDIGQLLLVLRLQ